MVAIFLLNTADATVPICSPQQDILYRLYDLHDLYDLYDLHDLNVLRGF
jgi:hypothetical protein